MDRMITVIGAAVVDILAGPVDRNLFTRGSVPAENMQIGCGGDALNEAVFLANLGMETQLISLLGEDEAAKTVLGCLNENGVSCDRITVSEGITTGTNIVLVDSDGERYFITNPKSSLRKLSKEHILPQVESMGDIVSFASIFVSPKLSVRDMEEVFRTIKDKPGRILVADMTTAKNGERIEDLEPVLKYLDYVIPNEKEAFILTGESAPHKSAESFIRHGAKNVIIKCGKKGCIYHCGSEEGAVVAYPADVIDTTGAGDSFVAGFIYGLYNGYGIRECCSYGCATASIVVEHMGAHGVKVDLEKVRSRIRTISC